LSKGKRKLRRKEAIVRMEEREGEKRRERERE
jgi:hypothetical protein